MGRLHTGQVGRPPFMSSFARSTKAAAWARLMRKRAIAGSGSGPGAEPPSSSVSSGSISSLASTTTRSWLSS